MSALDVTEVGKNYLRNIYSTRAYANSIVVAVLSARGNFCYMLHEIEWCYSQHTIYLLLHCVQQMRQSYTGTTNDIQPLHLSTDHPSSLKDECKLKITLILYDTELIPLSIA